MVKIPNATAIYGTAQDLKKGDENLALKGTCHVTQKGMPTNSINIGSLCDRVGAIWAETNAT